MTNETTAETYEAPTVRSLGSLHELTQGGGLPGFPGQPGQGGQPGNSWHHGSW